MTAVRRAFGGRRAPILAVLPLLLTVAGGLAAESRSVAAARGPLLDGAVFDGPTGAEGRPANHVDHVVFADGRFLSQGCARWGFGEADYEAWHEDGVIHFEAITVSPTHGSLAWRGSVAGDRVNATFVWTKQRILWTTRRAYWFRGIRAPARGESAGSR